MRDLDTIDSELQLVEALRRAARERGGPLPSIDVADALLDERRGFTEWATTLGHFYNSPVRRQRESVRRRHHLDETPDV